MKDKQLDIPHIPVLYNEILKIFKDVDGGFIVDCTLGYGGHSEGILNSNKTIKIIACDRDSEAINFSSKRLEKFGNRVAIYKNTFSKILPTIKECKIKGILADIGVSSLQLDKNNRGFSINSDELDMRMDKSQILDAKFIVNNYTEDELADILYHYGELPNSRVIASKIVNARANAEITSAKELSQIVGKNSFANRRVSVATLVFQAIRIAVNDELGELERLLDEIEKLAKNRVIDGAKIAIISFHSLEDRIIKNRFKTWEKNCICPEIAIKCECGNNHALGKTITKKPIVASSEEIKTNSRASCAKLRVFEIKA